jgi:alpha-glucosidase (family GH31 glycosyl hydrolase)
MISFGIFFISSAPQVFEVMNTKDVNDNRMVLNYIALGGPLEFMIFADQVPEALSETIHKVLGYSALPPFYALGLFQGSNAYDSLDKVKSNFKSYSDLGAPLEGMILNNYNTAPHDTFTFSDKFKGLGDYDKTLAKTNQRLILGVSMAIVLDGKAYEKARVSECLLNLPHNKGTAFGLIDETQVAYIDPFDLPTQEFFNDSMVEFAKTMRVDGLLLEDIIMPSTYSKKPTLSADLEV